MGRTRNASPSPPTLTDIRRAAIDEPNRLAELFPAAPVGLLKALRQSEESLRLAQKTLAQSESRERERSSEVAALLDAFPTPVFIAHDPACLHITGNRAADDMLRIPRGSEASLTAPTDTR